MKFEDIAYFLEESIILEKVDDLYIHNVNKETLFKILKDKRIIGSIQNDGATPKLDKSQKRSPEGYIPSKPELCLSRSDYNPQKTGILPTKGFERGKIIKIQLNMPEITSGHLRIKKPYPVSFGNYNRNRMLLPSVKGLEEICTKQASKELLKELISNLISKKNYQNTLEKKGKWLNKEKFENIISKIKKLENNPTVDKYIKRNLTDAWYDTGEDTGEERIEMKDKSIPVNSKYMTINIPDTLKDDPGILSCMENFKDDPKLFKIYKDTSREAYDRNDYY